MGFSTMKANGTRSTKWPKRLRFFITTVFPLLLVGTLFYALSVPHSYNNEAKELIDSIKTLLISEKLCVDDNDCRRKQYVLCEYSGGVYISLYGITDKAIIKKIVNLCIDKHARNPGILYELHMHPQTKDETLKEIKPKTTTLKLILKKEE